jgi:Zn-dependent protease/CBS domain-containing protein
MSQINRRPELDTESPSGGAAGPSGGQLPGTGRGPNILGLRIRLHWSWYLIVLLLTWGLAVSYYPSVEPHWTAAGDWIAGFATAILFFGSVLAHEIAHSLIARSRGMRVRRITLFIFGGISEIGDEPRSASDEFWMTIVGPGTSFALALIFFLIWLGTRHTSAQVISPVAGYLASINLAVGVFNLLPGFPLDGGRILRSLLWRAKGNELDATRIAARAGRIVALLIAGAGFALIFAGNIIDGIWLLLIAWFLDGAASAGLRQMQASAALAGLTAVQLAEDPGPWIDPDETLQAFAGEVVLTHNRRACFVGRGGELLGLITLSDLRRIPQARWGSTRVGEAMTPRRRLFTVAASVSAQAALNLMDEHGLSQMPVLRGDHAPLILTRDAIARALSNRLAVHGAR